MVRLAHVLSIALHPLFMPVFTLAVALWLDPHLGYFMDLRTRVLVLGMVALMTIAFPITSALLLIRSGMLSGLRMPGRKERIAPYTMTLLYYGMTGFLLARSPLHSLVLALMLGAGAALLLTTLITLRWKISAHMVGIGGATGGLFALGSVHGLPFTVPVGVALLLSGALGTARLLSSAHTPAQVYAGFVLGAVCTSAAVLVDPRLPIPF